MASSTAVCGVCDQDNVFKQAVVWCPECIEGLCDDCKQHHSKSKSSRNHTTIPITEYQNLPSHVLEIREYCEEHHEKFQLFCKQHGIPCCRLCVVDKHSKGLSAIERVIQNIKTSDLFKDTELLITEILDTIEKCRKNRTDNISSLKQNKKDVEEKILKARARINKHLDHIQSSIMQELTAIENKIIQQTNEVLTTLNEDQNQLMDYQATMSSIKQYATDLQAFLSINRVEIDVASKESCVEKLINTEAMQNTTISYEIDKNIQDLTETIPTLGEVIVQSLPCDIAISRQKHKQAQLMIVTKQPSAIANMSLKLQQKINTLEEEPRGCALLPDGRMVFACYEDDHIISFNKDGLQEFDISTETYTFDITYIEETNTIAVTSGYSDTQCITIIDMGNGKVKKTYPTESSCAGIAYRNNALIYTAGDKGLRIMELSNNSVSDIITSEMSNYAYIATFNDKLYYTNQDTNTVTCCDLQGKTQWKFKDESILKNPLGITVDNDGNVYVVGQESENVVVISPDGQQRRQLLSRDDGLCEPQVLHHDSSTNRLLVANECDHAFLYQVTRV